MEERKELLKNRQIMRFKCILCGKCCSDLKTLINVTFRDILRIKKFLNIQIQDILKYIGFYTFKDEKIEEYLEKMLYAPIITENGQAFIALLKKGDGSCIF
jgi:Fe-S-cluster containining protein